MLAKPQVFVDICGLVAGQTNISGWQLGVLHDFKMLATEPPAAFQSIDVFTELCDIIKGHMKKAVYSEVFGSWYFGLIGGMVLRDLGEPGAACVRAERGGIRAAG